MSRLLLHAGALLLGAVVALASVAVHRDAAGPLPWGLVLALGATFAVPWALAGVPGQRRLVTSYALGWVVLLGLVVTGRPEGDYAVAGDLPGYALMTAGLVLVVLGLAALPARGAQSARDHEQCGPPT